jgi:hypothetical protein
MFPSVRCFSLVNLVVADETLHNNCFDLRYVSIVLNVLLIIGLFLQLSNSIYLYFSETLYWKICNLSLDFLKSHRSGGVSIPTSWYQT